MNYRDNWLKSQLFAAPERVPLAPGMGRLSTRERWHSEGLPLEIDAPSAITAYAYREAGGSEILPAPGERFQMRERMIPEFEEKVLQKGERSQIVQDWKGNICEISNEFSVEHLRNAIDFVTRRWIKCPVESPADWELIKKRYDPNDPLRLPQDADALAMKLADRDWPVEAHFSGPFWQLREWLGFEDLCMMFHDEPNFVKEMIAFWEDYVASLLTTTFRYVTPDSVHISEDMAYKKFSMISPEMVKEFLLPTWKRWGELIGGAGCPIYAIDSDGYIGELVPVWIEAGFNVCDPIEVAAGNDLPEFRRRFGRDMAYRGGVDKRAIASGGQVIRDEIQRLTPVIASGGYIPGCDHGVPSNVSWPDFVEYTRLLAEAMGWM
ncbi:MAG: uroporphyrinogen decarboxylase family protein [Armatimonadota bacterium]|nr:uroporphyrinogen decarboxylase family protein [Armatimonadota bacterium]